MDRNMIARVVLSFAVVFAGLGLLAGADEKEKGGKEMSDKEFVQKAAIGGMFEVQSSKLAVDKSKDEKVKKFAEHMIKDHTKANKELELLAKGAGLELPTRLDEKHQKMIDTLRDAGDRFDREYASSQVKSHDEAVELFTNQAKSGKNAELRKWAEKTLPTIREHQMMAKRLAGGTDTPKRR